MSHKKLFFLSAMSATGVSVYLIANEYVKQHIYGYYEIDHGYVDVWFKYGFMLVIPLTSFVFGFLASSWRILLAVTLGAAIGIGVGNGYYNNTRHMSYLAYYDELAIMLFFFLVLPVISAFTFKTIRTRQKAARA